jgi:ubiquitin-conjugating enzyme E2 variant
MQLTFTTITADRIYTLNIQAPEDYPKSPPKIRFVTKIAMESVDPKTGEVHPKMFKDMWKINSTMALMLCHIRNNMKAASRLAQPPEGAEF